MILYTIKEGKLTAKFKEIIATASRIASQCPYCIDVHTKKAEKLDATSEELAEAIIVTSALRAGGSYAHTASMIQSYQDCGCVIMSSKIQEIIRIAREVIHSKVYQTTSVSDIMAATNIGKGQFYHYFQSKHNLGLAVVEDLVKDWERQLIIGIFNNSDDPITKLNRMLKWAKTSHAEMEIKYGYAMGNLAIEMSVQDEEFQVKIEEFF